MVTVIKQLSVISFLLFATTICIGQSETCKTYFKDKRKTLDGKYIYNFKQNDSAVFSISFFAFKIKAHKYIRIKVTPAKGGYLNGDLKLTFVFADRSDVSLSGRYSSANKKESFIEGYDSFRRQYNLSVFEQIASKNIKEVIFYDGIVEYATKCPYQTTREINESVSCMLTW